MWHVISLLVVLLYGAGCFAAQSMGGNERILLISIGGAVAVLILIGVIVQASVPLFQARLFRKKMDIRYILYFAFTFGQRAALYLDEHIRLQSRLSPLGAEVRRVPARNQEEQEFSEAPALQAGITIITT